MAQYGYEQRDTKSEVVSMKGIVKFFNSKKGYGSVEREDQQGDVFFHVSDVEEDRYLEQNDEVEFETAEDPGGKQKAVKVRRVIE
ncbi:hypothetical protein ES707_08122 [subsurface metagenome]